MFVHGISGIALPFYFHIAEFHSQECTTPSCFARNLFLSLLGVSIRLVPLSTETPHAKVATANIARIQIVEIPPQTPEPVLARLDEQIHLATGLRLDPFDVALHVEFCVAGANDGDLHVQKLGQSLLPLVRAGRVAQTRVEAYDGVEVRVEGAEMLRVVERVEVIHVGADLHLATKAIFDDGTEGVGRSSRREGEFVVAVCHAFGADEDQVEGDAREEVGELQPNFAWQRRFGSGAQDEDADWWRVGAQALDGDVGARARRVERVAEGWNQLLV